MSRKTESTSDSASIEGQTGQKLFDNYGPVNIRETIGTFLLGVLAILHFIALQRSWDHYQGLLEHTMRTEGHTFPPLSPREIPD